MKLVLCVDCWDVFKLAKEMRQCACGKVVGRYLDNLKAEVSENAISLAIGNGSIEKAIYFMKHHSLNGTHERQFYIHASPVVAWVRPNSGPGNPHTSELREITDHGTQS